MKIYAFQHKTNSKFLGFIPETQSLYGHTVNVQRLTLTQNVLENIFTLRSRQDAVDALTARPHMYVVRVGAVFMSWVGVTREKYQIVEFDMGQTIPVQPLLGGRQPELLTATQSRRALGF